MEDLLLRVVALRKGKLKSNEFVLRKEERGLSLFFQLDKNDGLRILDAVRAAGKQGDLALARLSASDIRSLGLVIRKTSGATGDEKIDQQHVEVFFPWWRRTLLRLRGVSANAYFNDKIAPKLCALANIPE